MSRFPWIIALTAILVALSPAAGLADTITLRADEWCPYNCEPGSDKPGYMVEIARAVFEPMGHIVDYDLTNWSRSIMQVRRGRIDGIIGAMKSEAPDLVFPDIETGFAGAAFFVRKGFAWRYTGINSLEKVALAVIQDYGYGKIDSYLETHRGTPKVITTVGEDALAINIRLLLKGRVDAVLENEAVFRNTATDMGVLAEIDHAGDDGETGENNFVYIVFSPKNPQSAAYAKALGEGMRTLRTSGRLAEILARYGLSDWR